MNHTLNKIRSVTFAATTTFFLTAIHSAAYTAIDNIGNGSNAFSHTLSGPTATGFFMPVPFPDREVAYSFTTGAEDTYLDSLSFTLNTGKGILSPVQVVLSQGALAPGGMGSVTLGSVAPSSSPANQVLTITPGFSTVLSASTSYWLHFTVPVGAALYSLPSSDGAVLASGWAMGITWYKTPSSAWTDGNASLGGDIRLNVTPIPEPSSALLGGLGVLILLRRRR